MISTIDIGRNNWLIDSAGIKVQKVKSLFELSKEKNTGENLPVLSLTQSGIKERDVSTNEGQIAENYDSYTRIRPGDIVFNPMDLRSGSVDLSKHNGVISLGYTVIRKKSNAEINLKYYGYYFYWHYLQHILFPFGRGVSTDHRWTLQDETLMNFPVLLPELTYQNNIVNYLETKLRLIDQIIEKKQKLINHLIEKRSALITQAVTKGLDPKAKMKPSGVSWVDKIPENYSLIVLKRVLSTKVTDGPHTTPDLVESGINFISAEAIQADNTIDFEKRRGFISEKDHVEFCKKTKPMMDDIFLVKSGATTGRVAIVTSNKAFSIWSPLALIRGNKEKIDPNFLYYVLISDMFQNQVKTSWSFGTQQNIGMGVIENLGIILPPIQVQKEIAGQLISRLNKFGIISEKVKKQIRILEEYRSSLIYHAVTGKIKI